MLLLRTRFYGDLSSVAVWGEVPDPVYQGTPDERKVPGWTFDYLKVGEYLYWHIAELTFVEVVCRVPRHSMKSFRTSTVGFGDYQQDVEIVDDPTIEALFHL